MLQRRKLTGRESEHGPIDVRRQQKSKVDSKTKEYKFQTAPKLSNEKGTHASEHPLRMESYAGFNAMF